MSVVSVSAVGSRRVRSEAIVSPDWCAADSVVFMPAGSVFTDGAGVHGEAPRRGLWQPSQVRRSPGRTWIQFWWVWNERPLAVDHRQQDGGVGRHLQLERAVGLDRRVAQDLHAARSRSRRSPRGCPWNWKAAARCAPPARSAPARRRRPGPPGPSSSPGRRSCCACPGASVGAVWAMPAPQPAGRSLSASMPSPMRFRPSVS